MKSYLVFPFHDPERLMFGRLVNSLPVLKKNFEKAFLSVTPASQIKLGGNINVLEREDFFVINYNSKNSKPGEHHLSGYTSAVLNTLKNDVLHLCTLDRLLFAIYKYKDSFLKDLRNASYNSSPTLFMRSNKALHTHPVNYIAIESMLNKLGEVFYQKEIDFSWCHLTIKNNNLKRLLPKLKQKTIALFPEIAIELQDQLITKKVDWLSWEDPFILNKDAKSYKKEIESDPKEDEKRLSYVIPGIKMLLADWHKKQD